MAKLSTLKSILIMVTTSLVLTTTKLVSASAPTLTIITSKPTYNVGETVIVEGNATLNGTLIEDALVALEIDTKYGYYVFRTLQTGVIQNVSWLVEMTDLYSCDMYGNPKDTFTRGSLGFVNVTWKNNSDITENVTLTLYFQFSTGSPFQISYDRVETPANSSCFLLPSFPIPPSAPTGTTTVFASLYTDFPRNGGAPYCPEKNASFTITSTSSLQSQPSAHPTSSASSISSFQTVIVLPRAEGILGNYTVYASCQRDNETVACSTRFQVILVGDIDEDKRVDMTDIGIVCMAYGSYPGYPKWNANADINGDNKVDMRDIGTACLNYGNTGV
jgi:hypothetical protein